MKRFLLDTNAFLFWTSGGKKLSTRARKAIEKPDNELTLINASRSGRFAIIGLVNECRPVCDGTGCSGCPPATQRTLLELDLRR